MDNLKWPKDDAGQYAILRKGPSTWVMIKYDHKENGVQFFKLCDAYTARSAKEYLALQAMVIRINEIGFNNYIEERK